MLDECELAAAVIEPHFDAVRDIFVDHEVASGVHLMKLLRTKLVIDPSAHDTERHYGRCREDGSVIMIAPEGADLDWEQLVAVLVHEFGHAADFAYPGSWVTSEGKNGKAVWIGDKQDKPSRKWRKLWHQRSDDQVEWAADAIAESVTGMKIQYCGHCMLQCFSGGVERPAGLR